MAGCPVHWQVRLVTTLASCFLAASQAMQVPDEQRLYKRIMGDYVKTVKPIVSSAEPLQVLFSIRLKQIVDLDERKQVLTTNVFIDQTWIDPGLAWNVSEFQDVVSLRIPAEKIWKPDTFIFNNADNGSTGFIHGKFVQIRHNGAVTWPVPVRLRSSCEVKIAYFPFDYQYCWVQFGSWIYSDRFVDYTIRPNAASVDLATYINNSEWALLAMRMNKTTDIRSRSTNTHPYLTMSLYLRRNTFFYLFNIIVPCIMLSVLTLMTFWLPPTSGEKVTLGLSVFLAFSMFMLLIADEVPASSDAVPIIGIYLCVVMTMTSLSVIFAVLVTNLYNRGAKLRPAPRWLACLCIRCLSVLVGVSRDIELLASTIHLPDHCRFHLIHNKLDLVNYKMDSYGQYSNQQRGGSKRHKGRRKAMLLHEDRHYVFDQDSSASTPTRSSTTHGYTRGQVKTMPSKSSGTSRNRSTSSPISERGEVSSDHSVDSGSEEQCLFLGVLGSGQLEDERHNETIPLYNCSPGHAQEIPQSPITSRTLRSVTQNPGTPNAYEQLYSKGNCDSKNPPSLQRDSPPSSGHRREMCSLRSPYFDDTLLSTSDNLYFVPGRSNLSNDVSNSLNDKFVLQKPMTCSAFMDIKHNGKLKADKKDYKSNHSNHRTGKTSCRFDRSNAKLASSIFTEGSNIAESSLLQAGNTGETKLLSPVVESGNEFAYPSTDRPLDNPEFKNGSESRVPIGVIENTAAYAPDNFRSGSRNMLESCQCASRKYKNLQSNQSKQTSAFTSIGQSLCRTSTVLLSAPLKKPHPINTCLSLPPTTIISSSGVSIDSSSSKISSSRHHSRFQPSSKYSSSSTSRCPQKTDATKFDSPRYAAISHNKTHGERFKIKDSQPAKLQNLSSPTKAGSRETFCECSDNADDVWIPRDHDDEVEDVWLLRDDFAPDGAHHQRVNTNSKHNEQKRSLKSHRLSIPYLSQAESSSKSTFIKRRSSAALRHLEQYMDVRSRLVLTKARIMVAEWQTIATVVDRLLFCITFFATLFAYIFLLVIAPYEHTALHSNLNLTLSTSVGRFDRGS